MKKNILIIDDTVSNIDTLVELLDEKYEIFAATNSQDASELLEEEKIDLVLLDIVMPDVDGFEICRRLKNNSKTENIPVIFITANSDEESIEKAYELGGVDYITKPFRTREVLSRINTHLLIAQQKFSLERNLEENITLLNQYKEVVDKSLIVSKTDERGIITYANEAFSKVSGYSVEELIGNSHNITRHPDMPKSVFNDLWKTVRSKKIWQGEVKNLKKDGSYYIVNATIMPILDSNEEIIEYISVRQDITEIYELKKEIEATHKEVVFTMGSICETRSKETGNHVKRVAEYSRILGKYAGLDQQRLELLIDASPMHDIGKVAIPDSILNKPAKLNKIEYETMKKHAKIGYQMLSHSKRPLLQTAAKIALEHHERWDGKGYPQHLKSEEISIEGRITAIADVFDALSSSRCYKQIWQDKEIFAYFKEERGKQFDPNLVDIFFEYLDEFIVVREKFKDI